MPSAGFRVEGAGYVSVSFLPEGRATSPDALLSAAVGLASDDGENVEYDRALAELLADTVFAVEGEPLDVTAAAILGRIRAAKA